jgi:hypothetical protein
VGSTIEIYITSRLLSRLRRRRRPGSEDSGQGKFILQRSEFTVRDGEAGNPKEDLDRTYLSIQWICLVQIIGRTVEQRVCTVAGKIQTQVPVPRLVRVVVVLLSSWTTKEKFSEEKGYKGRVRSSKERA